MAYREIDVGQAETVCPTMCSTVALLTLLLAVPMANAAEYDPQQVLARAAVKVFATNRHIPNYTCVETVTREYFRPAASQLPRACEVLQDLRRHPTLDMVLRQVMTDRLRLDVAMLKQGEVFSWAGDSRFDEGFMDRVTYKGPMATGLFGGLLILLFESDVKQMLFRGKKTVDGRTLFEYSYQVPRTDSHYKVKVENDWSFAGYNGTIRIDPETADLVEIDQESSELPPASGECQSTFHVELDWVTIGGGQFLLPKLARQRFVSPTANEFENTTEFANCREYRGESTVIFEEAHAQAGTGKGKAASKIVAPPAGSRFTFELTLPISSDRAAAGDLFHGRLVVPLLDSQHKVLAPRGTAVEGRLLRVESYRSPPGFLVVLMPEALDLKGSRVPLTARPDWQVASIRSQSKDRRRMVFDLPLPGEENAGVFRFPTEHGSIPRGFESDWRTVLPKPAAGPAR